jgi:hypothetical protein
MEMLEHVARMGEKRDVYRVLLWKSQGSRSHGKHMRRLLLIFIIFSSSAAHRGL